MFSKMKINLPVRMRNPWFWFGLIGVVLTALGTSIEQITSWPMLWDLLCEMFKSPALISGVVLSVVGTIVDPTTKGFGDSDRALSYHQPSGK